MGELFLRHTSQAKDGCVPKRSPLRGRKGTGVDVDGPVEKPCHCATTDKLFTAMINVYISEWGCSDPLGERSKGADRDDGAKSCLQSVSIAEQNPGAIRKAFEGKAAPPACAGSSEHPHWMNGGGLS